jgi:hypothetical protein
MLTAACGRTGSVSSPDSANSCGIARRCATPGEQLAVLWSRSVRVLNGSRIGDPAWSRIGPTCVAFDQIGPQNGGIARPQITWAMVLREVKRVGLPALRVRVQPADRTLVNFETIFYTEPEPFERELRLLGQRVDVRATASGFAWSFGDGASLQTQTPGAPYPAKDVVHEYADADVTVAPRVDVTYTAQFRVNGGGWQEIPETVTITGPPASLRILEATAVLVGGEQS